MHVVDALVVVGYGLVHVRLDLGPSESLRIFHGLDHVLLLQSAFKFIFPQGVVEVLRFHFLVLILSDLGDLVGFCLHEAGFRVSHLSGHVLPDRALLSLTLCLCHLCED